MEQQVITDKEWLSTVASLGCIVCRINGQHNVPPEIHHCISMRLSQRKVGDKETIPLCTLHHRGALGIHTLGIRRWQKLLNVSEARLLEQTKAEVLAKCSA